MSEPKAPGRPSLYTDGLAVEICERLSAGEPLAQICRDDHMPNRSTVYDWEKTRPELSRHIADARAEGFDALAAQCLVIADTPLTAKIVTEGPDGKTTRTEDALGHRKLQIETRLKLLAKWDPKRYGDLLKLGDPDGDSLTINIKRFTPGAG